MARSFGEEGKLTATERWKPEWCITRFTGTRRGPSTTALSLQNMADTICWYVILVMIPRSEGPTRPLGGTQKVAVSSKQNAKITGDVRRAAYAMKLSSTYHYMPRWALLEADGLHKEMCREYEHNFQHVHKQKMERKWLNNCSGSATTKCSWLLRLQRTKPTKNLMTAWFNLLLHRYNGGGNAGRWS